MSPHGELAEAPFAELTPLVPRPAVLTPTGGSWWVRLSEQVMSFLPLVLMGLLAAVSWWLVKNTPVPGGAGAVAVPRHEADYTMQDFAVATYGPGGALRSRLEGDLLRHFPDTDTIEVDGVRLRAVDEQGRVTLGSARRALSNGDATQLRLVGGARVVREPGPAETPGDRLEIRGELLEVFTETERVRSHLPVTLLTARGELRAGSLDYNHLDRSGQLGGRVTGELRPLLPTRRAAPASKP